MGITPNGLEYLLKSHNGSGWNYYKSKKLAMLGKQNCYFTDIEFLAMARKYNFELNINEEERVAVQKLNSDTKMDSYKMFSWFGFLVVDAIDYSDYEGATIVFDLQSKVLPDDLEGAYDYIYNGGTLEHVFDIATALFNTSRMLKIGGKILHDLPAHNWMNHGFYSFSPTWFLDYYNKNNWHVHDLFFAGFDGVFRSPDCRMIDDFSFTKSVKEKLLITCVAEKMELSSNDLIPNQSVYEITYKNYEQQVNVPDPYLLEVNKDVVLRQYLAYISKFDTGEVGIYGSKVIGEKLLQQARFSNCNEKFWCMFTNTETEEYYRYLDSYLPIKELNTFTINGLKTIIIAASKRNSEIIAERIQWVQEYGVKIMTVSDFL